MNYGVKKWWIVCLVAIMVISPILLTDTAQADKLSDAISKTPQGKDKGQIDPAAPKGFLDIPGAPNVNLILAFCWALWVGWIFSTVGAFGGVMAGVGHITVFGLAKYAGTFKTTSPPLNKVLTDSIRMSNQFLAGLSALIASMNYYKMGRLVLPLGIALGIGSLIGGYITPILTVGKVSSSNYIGFFGMFVLALGCLMLYETTPAGQASKKKAKQAAEAFEDVMRRQKCGEDVDTCELGVKAQSITLTKFTFTFYGVEFSFNPLYAILGGLVISAASSFLGVGGGFMLVPFLTSIAGLPMYLSAGTSAFGVLISMISSLFSYLMQGVIVHWSLIGIELVGILIGSVIGPRTSKYIPDIWLKRLFVVLAFIVGIDYTLKGFTTIKLLPG